MELIIIRHGQSTNNVTMMSDPFAREADPPLTALGLAQAQRLAAHLANGPNLEDRVVQLPGAPNLPRGCGLTRLLCSPMRRALQTAQPAAAALGLPVEVWVDVHEHGGLYLLGPDGEGQGFPGLTADEMRAQFPGCVIPPEVTDQGWWNPARGKEDLAGCMARAVRVAARLRGWAETQERVALVTHGTFADKLLKALYSALPGDGLQHWLYNASLTRLDFHKDGRLTLRYLNRVDHLEGDLVSS